MRGVVLSAKRNSFGKIALSAIIFQPKKTIVRGGGIWYFG